MEGDVGEGGGGARVVIRHLAQSHVSSRRRYNTIVNRAVPSIFGVDGVVGITVSLFVLTMAFAQNTNSTRSNTCSGTLLGRPAIGTFDTATTRGFRIPTLFASILCRNSAMSVAEVQRILV